MKGIVVFIILCCCLLGCKQKVAEESTAGLENDTTSVAYKIPFPKQNIPLSTRAQEATSGWLAYITASSEIDNFRKYAVKDVIYYLDFYYFTRVR